MANIKVGEINIEYYVEGSGPPLLMIMGWVGQRLLGRAVHGAAAAALHDDPVLQPRHRAQR